MKKFTALFLAMLMLLSVPSVFAEGPAVPWEAYDNLLAAIKSESDFVKREALMHQAEDMLMETGALVPIYYYSDYYLSKPDFQGFYSNVFGQKYFHYATNGDKNYAALNIGSEPSKLDPTLNTTVDGSVLAVAAFGGLLTTDAAGKVVAHLASDWSKSEDGLTYTINVRDGLTWSDGVELNAKDFEYSWKRAVAKETAADYAKMFDVIKGYPDELAVTASEDGKTLTVELAGPCAYFEDLLAFPTYFAVPKHAVEAAEGNDVNPGAWATEAGFPVSGPFKLVEWKHDESMIYEKNPNYFDAENVKLEKLEFMLTADTAVAYAAYQAGNLDFVEDLSSDDLTVLKDSPEYTLRAQLGTYYIMFNVKSNLFAGKTVEQANAMRRAFAHLIDRDYIVDTILHNTAIPANSFIPADMADGHGGLFKASDAEYTYPSAEDNGYFPLSKNDDSVAKAVELLKEAGYEFDDNNMLSASTPISFEYIYNTNTNHENIAQSLQNDFAEIGINITLKNYDWAIYLDERKAGNYTLARAGWVADFNDPINMLEMWATDSGNNDAHFGR